MSAITEAKELSEFSRQFGNIELERKILSLHGEVVELTDKNQKLSEQMKKLEGVLEMKGKLKFTGQWYVAEDERFPYCSKCWDSDSKAIHLTPSFDPSVFRCPECKNLFGKPSNSMVYSG